MYQITDYALYSQRWHRLQPPVINGQTLYSGAVRYMTWLSTTVEYNAIRKNAGCLIRKYLNKSWNSILTQIIFSFFLKAHQEAAKMKEIFWKLSSLFGRVISVRSLRFSDLGSGLLRFSDLCSGLFGSVISARVSSVQWSLFGSLRFSDLGSGLFGSVATARFTQPGTCRDFNVITAPFYLRIFCYITVCFADSERDVCLNKVLQYRLRFVTDCGERGGHIE